MCLEKITEPFRNTCKRVSKSHFGESHIMDDECPGQATLSTTLLELPPLLPIWLNVPNHMYTWKVADMPRSLTLTAQHWQEKYYLTAVHLHNGNHFTGNVMTTTSVLLSMTTMLQIFYPTGVANFPADTPERPDLQVFCDPHAVHDHPDEHARRRTRAFYPSTLDYAKRPILVMYAKL